MACGKPSVYAIEKESSFARIVDHEQLGLVVEQGDDQALAFAISQYADNRDLLKRHSENSLRYAREKLDRSQLTSAFKKVLERTVESR